MRAIIAIKRLAAVVLLVALFLPLSKCTVEEPNAQTKAIERTVTVTYAYTAYRSSIVDALTTYVAFLWPLLLAIAGAIRPALDRRWTVALLEVVLCLGSAYELLRLTLLGEWLYGAYVAAGAIGAYLLAALAALGARLWAKWVRRPAIPAPH